MTGVLASEWLKLRSVRSTWYLLGVAVLFVALLAGFAFYVVSLWESLPGERQAAFRAAPPERIVLLPVQICAAVLGVLAITSEYATGTIRTSFAVVPRRGAVLAGKAAVVVAAALAAGQASVFATFFAGRAIVGDRPMSPGHLTAVTEEIPMLLASGLSTVVVALVGLGLGTATRSAAGAVVALSGLLFVLPTVAGVLPAPWSGRIGSVLLPNLAGQLAGHPSAVGSLSPVGALGVMTAYAVTALGAGALGLTRRDA
ncbi:ABC transporter permease [Streptosporangium sp. CA-135522]|uniref:ABC transporter permease n=1 Tax=Streptosporangium sp. CA-135522 TaxID=3240072 RepID=UPI003D8AC3B8